MTGTIDIGGNNSIIAGSQWVADYDGNLSWDSGSVDLDGDVIGQFQGNRTSDPDNIIKGTIGGDLSGTGVMGTGGSLADVEFVIVLTDTP